MRLERKYVVNKVSEIRKNKGEFFFSNIITIPEDIEKIYENENGIAFVIDDKGVKRGYLAANHPDSLKELCRQIPAGTGIEVIGADMDPIVERIFDATMIVLFQTFLRASNKDLIHTLDDNIPEKFKDVDYRAYVQRATPEYLDQIYDILYETFDPLVNHLQSREELLQDILDGNVNIAVEDGIVQTIHTYKFSGKKIYLEHLVNRGKSVLTHSLYYYILKRAVEQGINYADTWMRDDNERIWAFVKRYGIVADGLKDFIYVKKTRK